MNKQEYTSYLMSDSKDELESFNNLNTVALHLVNNYAQDTLYENIRNRRVDLNTAQDLQDALIHLKEFGQVTLFYYGSSPPCEILIEENNSK